MPTYQNRSGLLVNVGDYGFSPGEKKPIGQYLNISDYPEIVKIDENPPINNGWHVIFENQNTPSNMSRLFHGRVNLVLSIRDGSSIGASGNVVEVVAFAGITDRISEMVPVKVFTFTRRICKDDKGIDTPYWFPDKDYRLGQQFIDVNYEMIAFQITSFTGSGNINVLIKSY